MSFQVQGCLITCHFTLPFRLRVHLTRQNPFQLHHLLASDFPRVAFHPKQVDFHLISFRVHLQAITFVPWNVLTFHFLHSNRTTHRRLVFYPHFYRSSYFFSAIQRLFDYLFQQAISSLIPNQTQPFLLVVCLKWLLILQRLSSAAVSLLLLIRLLYQ